jgi:hypothetical protein
VADLPIGYQRTLEAVNAGEDLAAFINVLISNIHRTMPLLTDALSCLVGCHESARRAGHFATPSLDPEIRQLLAKSGTTICFELTLALSGNDGKRTSKMISGLLESVNELRRKMHWPDTRQTATSTLIDVRVVAMPPSDAPEVVSVKVIEMPKRIRTVSLICDEAGEAVGSTHVEVDA